MMRNSQFSLAGIMMLMVLVLQGCGHKGPLYLPKKTATPAPAEQKK